MKKQKRNKKKAVIHVVDVPVSSTSVKVVRENARDIVAINPPKSILKTSVCKQPEPQPSTSGECKYMMPELFSTLGVCRKIERIKNTQLPAITNSGQLTPVSKKQLNTKITKTLNHQLDTNVYSKLTPVGLNGDLQRSTEADRKLELTGKKDPEPILSDYLVKFLPYVITYELSPLMLGETFKCQDNFKNIQYVMSILEGDVLSKSN